MNDNRNIGPGGIVWSYDGVATVPEIVATFNELEHDQIARGNWGCAADDERDLWHPTTGTYINGVVLTVDMDYMMGYLIQAVDRNEPSTCTYITIVQYHGRDRETGEIQHDYQVWQGPTHGFFDAPEHILAVSHWALDAVDQMVTSHVEALRDD